MLKVTSTWSCARVHSVSILHHNNRWFAEYKLNNFKPSIETENESKRRSTGSNYGRVIVTASIGSVCFFAMGNHELQKKMSNVINQNFCLDYRELKESYESYLNKDLSTFPRTEPAKRILAVVIDSIVVGFVSGAIGLPMFVRVAMVMMSAKYANSQSPGFMLMGLRGIYIDASDTVDAQWRARMDYTNFIRRQFAFHPVELCIYSLCLGSIGTASIISALVYGSHIAQFYGSTNRTWLDKWAKIQVIDLSKLEHNETNN